MAHSNSLRPNAQVDLFGGIEEPNCAHCPGTQVKHGHCQRCGSCAPGHWHPGKEIVGDDE